MGWVLSILDQIGFTPPPAVGVLPLGTGNDLARALGWGGGYTDEPIGKILENIAESDTILLDRWNLSVDPNPNGPTSDDGKDKLPLSVVNNYFSLGVDAHIALEFHEARGKFCPISFMPKRIYAIRFFLQRRTRKNSTHVCGTKCFMGKRVERIY